MTRCFICGHEPLTGALCGKHSQLATVWAAVAGGVLSDWPSSLPNHAAMMTLASRGHGANWQVDLAVILSTHGVMLDDGAGYGE